MAWLFDRDPGGAGHLCSPLRLRLLKRILGVELCGGCGVAPVRRRERWSPTAEAARPPRVVLSWRRLRGSLRVIRIRCCSLRRVVRFVAAASRRRILHGSDPLGAMLSTSSFLFRRRFTLRFFDDYKRVEWMDAAILLPFCCHFEWSGVASFEYSSSRAVCSMLMPQSNWLEFDLRRHPNPTSLSYVF